MGALSKGSLALLAELVILGDRETIRMGRVEMNSC